VKPATDGMLYSLQKLPESLRRECDVHGEPYAQEMEYQSTRSRVDLDQRAP